MRMQDLRNEWERNAHVQWILRSSIRSEYSPARCPCSRISGKRKIDIWFFILKIPCCPGGSTVRTGMPARQPCLGSICRAKIIMIWNRDWAWKFSGTNAIYHLFHKSVKTSIILCWNATLERGVEAKATNETYVMNELEQAISCGLYGPSSRPVQLNSALQFEFMMTLVFRSGMSNEESTQQEMLIT